MKDTFQKLHNGTPDEKVDAFLQIEKILPNLTSLDPSIREDFVALGRWVSKSDEWTPETAQRFRMRAVSVENQAKAAGYVVDSDGYRAK